MQKKSEIQQGWEFAANLAGANYAADYGSAYVEAVNKAIEELENNINYHTQRGQAIPFFQGFVAEEYGAGTFNIDAVAAGSDARAKVLHETGKFSVDVELNTGEQYSFKSYGSGDRSAKAQAVFNSETGKAGYDGHHRWVPTEQLGDAKTEAHHQALRNKLTRPDVADAYAETENRLTDVVKNDEGISSRPATRKELDKMAADGKKQEFRADEVGVTADSAITTEYMIQQAIKAGYTTAAITTAMQMAPEIYKAIDYLIKHGEINVQQVKHMGVKAITSGAEGFLRGSVSCTLMIMCEKGVFGEAFKKIEATELGAIVAIVMQTTKNAVLVAAGRISANQMGAAFVDSLIVTGGYFAGTAIAGKVLATEIGQQIGGIIGQALGFELPVLGYLLGSLIGTSFAVVYNIGKKKLISFCVDTGFTCFGLVEQNYELPEDVLSEMGVKQIPIPRVDVQRADIEVTTISSGTDTAEYETIDITVLKRGIIGVNKVGYIFK